MRILLLSANAGDKTFFTAVAKAAAIPLAIVGTPDEVCTELEKDSNSAVVVDTSTEAQYKAFETSVSNKLGLYSSILNVNSLFYVSSTPLHETPYVVNSMIFGHFIPRTFAENDAPLVARIILASRTDFSQPLEKYFDTTTPPKLITMQMTNSNQKYEFVDKIRAEVVQLGFKSRMATMISAAADELMMNAIFDAPVDQTGKHIYLNTPRNTEIALSGKSSVEIKLAFDGTVLGLSVVDHYGSLDKKKVLSQHIGKSYETRDYETRAATTAGAGLGLAHVYRNCGGIVFECETGAKTDAMLFYRKAESFKDFKDQFRFLSTFVYFS